MNAPVASEVLTPELVIQEAVIIHDQNLKTGAAKPGEWDVVKWLRDNGSGPLDCRCRLRRTGDDEIEVDYAYVGAGALSSCT